MDVAIRVGELADSRLISQRPAPHRVGIFASPDYLKRRSTPDHPDQLVEHDCGNFRFQSSGQVLHYWALKMGDRPLDIVPKSWIVTDESSAVMAMLVAGGGIGISTTYIPIPM